MRLRYVWLDITMGDGEKVVFGHAALVSIEQHAIELAIEHFEALNPKKEFIINSIEVWLK
jgi:hypothetical protein